jgi:hypothetical protein
LYPRTCAQCFEYASAPAGNTARATKTLTVAEAFAPVRLNSIAQPLVAVQMFAAVCTLQLDGGYGAGRFL